MVKNLPAMQENWVQSLGRESICNSRDPGLIPSQEDPLEKEMTTHSSFLAWKIPWTEEPGGLQVQGVAKSQSRLHFHFQYKLKDPPANVGDIRDAGLIPGLGRSPGEGNGNPLQYSYLENSMDRGAWWATVYGIIRVGPYRSIEHRLAHA